MGAAMKGVFSRRFGPGRHDCLALTLVELLQESDLRWQVQDASNSRPVARFLSRCDAEQFMHLNSFLRDGLVAVPPKLRGMFVPWEPRA
jgi:hypothetical protein